MNQRLLLSVLLLLLFTACTRAERLTEKVFVVNIKPGEETLRQYEQYHAAVWPEVEEGFRKAGYRRIRLFRSAHTVVMVITVPEGADLAAMGKTAEGHHPRCAEWNRLMAGYQEGIAGALPGQTWTEALPLYSFGSK